jgi:hypothetical protein
LADLEEFGHRGFEGLIGAARRDITPHLGVRARCWGPAEHDLAEGVHRPLTLTALALRERDGGDPLLLLSADLMAFRLGDDEWRVRGRILRELELRPERVVFHLVHTHSGPSLNTDEPDLPGGDQVAGYLDSLGAQAVSAGREALAALRHATLEWTSGTCRLAANRDLDHDGRALVGYNPRADADDTVLVGRVTDAEGSIVATLVNYACHPTTLAWQNRLLSPDYVGSAREVIEHATGGAPCLFLQGASGELAPREQYVGDTALADRHGRELGHAALSALAGMLPPHTRLSLVRVVESGAPLAVWEPSFAPRRRALRAAMSHVELALQPLPTLDELARRWHGIDPRSLGERLSRARSLRAPYGSARTLRYPLWSWMIGDSYLVAHPGEAYSLLQSQLRARYRDAAVVVMNLSNGPGFFYFPTEEAYASETYSSWQTLVDKGALEVLVAQACSAVQRLAEEASRAGA